MHSLADAPRPTPPARTAAPAALGHGRLASFLAATPWVDALAPEESKRVMASAQELLVPRGGVVIRCGDPAHHWFGVMDGLLVQVVTTHAGKCTELATASAGLWFGEGTLLKGERWRYDVIALRRSRLALMPRSLFDNLRATSLPFNHFLQALLNSRLGLCVEMLAAERLLDPETKVARLLASFYVPELNGHWGPFIPVSQKDLAMLAGLSRQRTNVALNKLQELGCIQIRRDGIAIRDLVTLRTFEPRP